MIGLADSMEYLFYEYAIAVAAGVLTLSLFSVMVRLLWEFR